MSLSPGRKILFLSELSQSLDSFDVLLVEYIHRQPSEKEMFFMKEICLGLARIADASLSDEALYASDKEKHAQLAAAGYPEFSK